MTKRCNECKHLSTKNERYTCTHPALSATNPWFLSGLCDGTSAFDERSRRSPFAPCGRAGKLWEPREGKA